MIRGLKLYAKQLAKHEVRMIRTIPKDLVTIDEEGKLVHDKWPPEDFIEIERKPDDFEDLKIENGKAVYTQITREPNGPTVEDRLKELEAKQ